MLGVLATGPDGADSGGLCGGGRAYGGERVRWSSKSVPISLGGLGALLTIIKLDDVGLDRFQPCLQ